MEKLIQSISIEIGRAFAQAGYAQELGKVTVSNRPDLCEYQCNGAMAGAKMYHKAPLIIAQEVAAKLADSAVVRDVCAAAPGFLNFNVSEQFLADYLSGMKTVDRFGLPEVAQKTIIVDYGGANVAKPLHIGHLRAAVIGESIKRILSYCGHKVIGDVHLGDWGLQMGLVIAELSERQPDLVYFDENYEGEYPSDPPFTISELEEIYPAASKKAKAETEEGKAFAAKAHDATVRLQEGDKAYTAIWKHIMKVSLDDLKANYDKLDIHFDLWKGESDVQYLIPEMVQDLKDRGLAYYSEGALVVDVAEESDKKEVPPCLIVKSDGASLYQTTDLATILERERLYHPDGYVYVVDKRQDMHFTQVFRVSRKAGYVKDDAFLTFIGFGTMNGKDGKPFKTRNGGVMRLEYLIDDIAGAVYDKIMENREEDEETARKNAAIIGLAALKYGDLSNQATKDYVFDIDRFTSFEGNTGPYILYTIVRIKSILNKAGYEASASYRFSAPQSKSEKDLMADISRFQEMMEIAAGEFAPHRICSFIYDLANEFNHFYHETKIVSEENEENRRRYLELISLTKDILTVCIDLLGFSAPDRM